MDKSRRGLRSCGHMGDFKSSSVTGFGVREEEWGVLVAAEIRTQISASRVRLPDIVVVPAGPQPGMLVDPPLIEILSPDDSYTKPSHAPKIIGAWCKEHLAH